LIYTSTVATQTWDFDSDTKGTNMADSRIQTDQALRTAYAKLVAATWHDTKVLDELKKKPHEVLTKYGLHTKPGAHITIEVVKPTGEGSFQSLRAAWLLGDQTGRYTIWLPEAPDGVELVKSSNGGGTTCTPCCCCT
jgi:hypothetical protein